MLAGESLLDDDDAGDVRIEDHEQIRRVGREAFRPNEQVRTVLDVGQVDLGHATEADGPVLERRLDDIEVGDDLWDRVDLRTDEGVEVRSDPLRTTDRQLDLDLSGQFRIDFGPTDFDFGGQVALWRDSLNHGFLSLHCHCLPELLGQDLCEAKRCLRT